MSIAVIGAGAWGINHVRTLAAMSELKAVVEPVAELRNRVTSEFPDIPTYESLEQFWQDEAVAAATQGFVIATPAQTHAPLALELFEHGKHVLVEKPMALSVEDAESIVQAGRASGKTLTVGHLLLFQPAIQFIKQYLSEGNLGKIYTLTQRRSKLGRARRVENVLWSFGVHDVAVLLYLVGEAPVNVSQTGHAAINSGIEDDVHLHLIFPGGSIANLHNSWLWPRVERELIIVGEKGILEYDEIKQQVILHQKGIDADTLQNIDQGQSVIFEGEAQPLRLELENFLHCIRSGDTPIANGTDGVEVVKVLASVSG